MLGHPSVLSQARELGAGLQCSGQQMDYYKQPCPSAVAPGLGGIGGWKGVLTATTEPTEGT